MPKFARFAPQGREILHSSRILPLNFFAFAILARNLTQLQEKFYTVRTPLLWYPSSIESCTRRTAADFTEKNVHVSREKSPLSPRKMSMFAEKSYTLLIYILNN